LRWSSPGLESRRSDAGETQSHNRERAIHSGWAVRPQQIVAAGLKQPELVLFQAVGDCVSP